MKGKAREVVIDIEQSAGCDPLKITIKQNLKTNDLHCSAGRTTTNEELEDMLEQGNPAVFTQVGICRKLQ